MVKTMLLLCFGTFAFAFEVTIEEVVLHQVQYYQAIDSLEFTYKKNHIAGQGDFPPSTPSRSENFSHVNRVIFQGTMWRGDLNFDPETFSSAEQSTSSYNGEVYHLYQREERDLAIIDISPGHAFGTIPPNLMLFWPWATADELFLDNGYVRLKDAEVWEKFLNLRSPEILEETVTIGDHECVVIRIPFPAESVRGLERQWFEQIYCAKDADFFPIRYEKIGFGPDDSIINGDTEVLDFAPVGKDGLNFALEIIQRTWNKDGTLAYVIEYSISPDSIRLNEPIDENEFTISPLLAVSYYNQFEPETSFRLADPNALLRNLYDLIGEPQLNDQPSSMAHHHPARPPVGSPNGDETETLRPEGIGNAFPIALAGSGALLALGLAVRHRLRSSRP